MKTLKDVMEFAFVMAIGSVTVQLIARISEEVTYIVAVGIIIIASYVVGKFIIQTIKYLFKQIRRKNKAEV